MIITGPAMRWHGGKYRLAPWIVQHLPPHRKYTEGYGGAGSVLMRKAPVYAEVYNDLDDEVVTLFRVLRDPDRSARLIALLELTPFARVEWEACYAESDDPVEIARALIVRCHMGFGSDGANRKVRTGFRANSSRAGTTPSHDWRNYPGRLPAIIQRLAGVIIEHRPALDVIRAHDTPDCLHYVDPPYVPDTRSQQKKAGVRYHGYAHEMTADDHAALLEALNAVAGMVVLSGYPSALYEAALGHWTRVEREATTDGSKVGREVLWINPAAMAARAGRLI